MVTTLQGIVANCVLNRLCHILIGRHLIKSIRIMKCKTTFTKPENVHTVIFVNFVSKSVYNLMNLEKCDFENQL